MHSYENPELSYECDLTAERDRLAVINAELLQALQDLLYACDGISGGVNSDGAANRWTNAKAGARAAISKATGGQS